MPVNDYGIILSGVAAIIAAIGTLGIIQAKREPTKSMPADVSNIEVSKLVVALNANTEALGHNTHAANNSARAVEDVQDDLRELRHELRIGAGKK